MTRREAADLLVELGAFALITLAPMLVQFGRRRLKRMERRWRRATEQRRRRLARLMKHPRRAVLALAALLAVGCADQPAAPTPPVIAPAPPAVSVEIEPTTARVGEVVTFTYRLSRALDEDLEFWTEVTGTGETIESGPLTIRARENVQVYSTGYLREIDVGTWTMRIMGERLPDGVVLGSPAGGTWTVLP